MAQLYDFKQRYPDADIEPFLSRSSDFFKNYIERGLKFIEEKKRKEQIQGLQPTDNNNPCDENVAVASSGHESGVNPDAYRERLKKLRALAGLETNEVNDLKLLQFKNDRLDMDCSLKVGANTTGFTSHFGYSATSVTQISSRTVSTISTDNVIVSIFAYFIYPPSISQREQMT